MSAPTPFAFDPAHSRADRRGAPAGRQTRPIPASLGRADAPDPLVGGYPWACSPRTLARVLRLQRFLMLAERDGDDLARLAADAGYADQAHLSRDCSELGGLPAGALLATGAVPAGERFDRL